MTVSISLLVVKITGPSLFRPGPGINAISVPLHASAYDLENWASVRVITFIARRVLQNPDAPEGKLKILKPAFA